MFESDFSKSDLILQTSVHNTKGRHESDKRVKLAKITLDALHGVSVAEPLYKTDVRHEKRTEIFRGEQATP